MILKNTNRKKFFKNIKKSLKYHLGLKDTFTIFFNPFLFFKLFKITRNKEVELNLEDFNDIYKEVKDQINLESAILLASPVWRNILKGKLKRISSLLLNKEFNYLKEVYQELFITDLMAGAVSHQKDISIISRISQGTRFFKRYKKIKTIKSNYPHNLIKLIDKLVQDEIYNYGKPLIYKTKKFVNIEHPDELYFALSFIDLLKNNFYEEIVFIGDGAGFLIPIIIKINNFIHKGMQSKYRIVDFLHFAVASYLRINNDKKNIFINLPEVLHDFDKNNIKPKFLAPIKGRRLIINQDSFPEMKRVSLISYLKNTAEITDIASYNQLPEDLCANHSDYISILKDLNYKLLQSKESLLRSGYFISIYSNQK